MSSYSRRRTCVLCGQPITNRARFCSEHTGAFRSWLYIIYSRQIKLPKKPLPPSKAERTRQSVLAALADGPMSTPDLGRAIGKGVEAVRYACEILEKRGRVRIASNGYRTVWALVDDD